MFSEPQTPEVYDQAELFYCDLGTSSCSEFYKVSEIKTKCVLNKPTSFLKKCWNWHVSVGQHTSKDT